MSFPTSGVVPMTLSPDLFASTSKKRKRDEEQLIALKYAFKPGSMGSSTETTIQNNEHGGRVLRADTTSHGTQVFDIREEQSKARECVMIYDPKSNTFTLHPLPATYNLALNRSASTATNRSAGRSSTSSSTSSSSSLPLAEKTRASTTTIDAPTPSKKTRPSETITAAPPKSTKAVPTALPSHGAIPSFSEAKGAGKGKAGARKSLPARPPAKNAKDKVRAPPAEPKGKFRSAETIDDSDEEAGLVDAAEERVQEMEEEDEFAKMLQESVNESEPVAQGYEDEDDDEDEDEDEDDDELGGAVLAVRQHVPSNSFGNGESEWL